MTTMLHRWNVPASQPLTMSDRALCGATPIDTPCPADDAPIDCPECTFSALPVDVVAELRALEVEIVASLEPSTCQHPVMMSARIGWGEDMRLAWECHDCGHLEERTGITA